MKEKEKSKLSPPSSIKNFYTRALPLLRQRNLNDRTPSSLTQRRAALTRNKLLLSPITYRIAMSNSHVPRRLICATYIRRGLRQHVFRPAKTLHGFIARVNVRPLFLTSFSYSPGGEEKSFFSFSFETDGMEIDISREERRRDGGKARRGRNVIIGVKIARPVMASSFRPWESVPFPPLRYRNLPLSRFEPRLLPPLFARENKLW